MLFQDKDGLWRCKGRLAKANIPLTTRHPVLLPRQHHLTYLLVRDAHERVLHNGVNETLVELRSKYWITKGRQFIRKIIRKHETKPFQGPQPPPLPEFRVKEAPPFTYFGQQVVRTLFIHVLCCSSSTPRHRSRHDIKLISVARRGFPQLLVSDNAKTFKSAERIIRAAISHPDMKRYFADINMDWSFTLQRAPWWGGIYERMIKSVKQKTIGKAKLTYDELLTAIAEVEMIINCRPLSYTSSEDIQEPLTPAHLILCHRLLNLPDNLLRWARMMMMKTYKLHMLI